MKIPFSNALYYPNIDIKDTDWLKTAVLFWDSISTIVPEEMAHPYNGDTEFLADEGFLHPIYVNSSSEIVTGVEDAFARMLSYPEVTQLLLSSNEEKSRIYDNKMSLGILSKLAEVFLDFEDKYKCELKELENEYTILSREIEMRTAKETRLMSEAKDSNAINMVLDKKNETNKLSAKANAKLTQIIDGHKLIADVLNVRDKKAFILNKDVTNFYMASLANSLSESKRLAMITDNNTPYKLSHLARFDNPENNMKDLSHLSQGMLLQLIIEGLNISPDCTLHDIIAFKNKYHDELVLFRTELANLTQYISTDKPTDYIRNEIEEIYKTINARYNAIKKALKGRKIKWVAGGFIEIASVFLGAGLSLKAGLPVETASLIGAGSKVAMSTINYITNRKTKLTETPYSYLLKVEKGIF